jgi:hypothetical protein
MKRGIHESVTMAASARPVQLSSVRGGATMIEYAVLISPGNQRSPMAETAVEDVR